MELNKYTDKANNFGQIRSSRQLDRVYETTDVSKSGDDLRQKLKSILSPGIGMRNQQSHKTIMSI